MDPGLDVDKIAAMSEEHERVTDELLARAADIDTQLAASKEFTGALMLVRKLRHTQRILAVVGALLLVTVGVVATVVVKAEANSNAIDRRAEATVLFCEQTNINNERAHRDFLARFAPTDDAVRLAQFTEFADVAWPQRECSPLGK